MDNNLFSMLLRSSYSGASTGLYIIIAIIAIGFRIFRIINRNSSNSGSSQGVQSSAYDPSKLKKTIAPTSQSCGNCGEHLPYKATSCPVCFSLVPKSQQDSQVKNQPEQLSTPPKETLYKSPEVKPVKKQRVCPHCGVPVKRWAKYCDSCFENL